MNKLIGLAVAGVAVFALSGCGGGDDYYVDPGPVYETYFITDGFGNGVSNIIYDCDSGSSGVTNFEGAFKFDIIGDNCNFDLVTNLIVDDLFLEYDNDPHTDAGINGIYFECIKNGAIISSGDTSYDPQLDFNGFIEDGSLYDGCTLFDVH